MPRKPTGRPPGRPRDPNKLTTKRVTVSLGTELWEALTRLAHARHQDIAEVVRTLIAQYVKDQEPRGG